MTIIATIYIFLSYVIFEISLIYLKLLSENPQPLVEKIHSLLKIQKVQVLPPFC